MSYGECYRWITGISKPRFTRCYDLWKCVAVKNGAECWSIGTTPKEAWDCFRVIYLPWPFWSLA